MLLLAAHNLEPSLPIAKRRRWWRLLAGTLPLGQGSLPAGRIVKGTSRGRHSVATYFCLLLRRSPLPFRTLLLLLLLLLLLRLTLLLLPLLLRLTTLALLLLAL